MFPLGEVIRVQPSVPQPFPSLLCMMSLQLMSEGLALTAVSHSVTLLWFVLLQLSINHVLRGDAHIQQGVTSLPAPADSCQSRLAPSSSGFPNCEMRKQEQLTPRLKDKPSPKLPG